ncbi:MAG: hypothetical protein AB7P49_01535 [Bdellovibrionales bacterium]
MKRHQRVALAKQWAESVKTKKKVRAYQKRFGVDKCCAAKELMMAGVELTEKYAERWATRHERRSAGRKARRKSRRHKQAPEVFDSDYHFYFIAGHTSRGFAYGITWEEAHEHGLIDELP